MGLCPLMMGVMTRGLCRLMGEDTGTDPATGPHPSGRCRSHGAVSPRGEGRQPLPWRTLPLRAAGTTGGAPRFAVSSPAAPGPMTRPSGGRSPPPGPPRPSAAGRDPAPAQAAAAPPARPHYISRRAGRGGAGPGRAERRGSGRPRLWYCPGLDEGAGQV